MRAKLNALLLFFAMFWANLSYAQPNCDAPSAQISLDANNVKANLMQGGSFWWNGESGQYIFPYIENSPAPVSAFFAGGLWVGGLDPGGTIKIAGQTYGASNGNTDFWPGPLVYDEFGIATTDNQTCSDWDLFFKVSDADINAFKADWEDNGVLDNPIPASIKAWPAKGNPFFFEEKGFDLPASSQSLAPFIEPDINNANGIYNPADGDYPNIKGATQAIWWVFNDLGNAHTATGSADKLVIEVQMMAYAYASDIDAINNTTFYDIKLIHRGIEPLGSAYLSLWADPDLGCHTDDYVGCIPEENMAIFYNEDAIDGTQGCVCDFGINSYCEEPPLVAIKSIGGWRANAFQPGIGLSSFLSYGSGATGSLPPEQTDPNLPAEYYNLMSGHWKDGSAIIDPNGNETLFQFPDAPNNTEGWSMCTDEEILTRDNRVLMNFGPVDMAPGAIFSITFAVIGIENVNYPCPDLTAIIAAGETVEDFLDIPTANNEISLPETAIIFSPNPVAGQAILQLKIPDVEINKIDIYNAEGKRVRQEEGLKTQQYRFEKNGLSPGLYIYKLITNDGRIAIGKIIVQ